METKYTVALYGSGGSGSFGVGETLDEARLGAWRSWRDVERGNEPLRVDVIVPDGAVGDDDLDRAGVAPHVLDFAEGDWRSPCVVNPAQEITGLMDALVPPLAGAQHPVCETRLHLARLVQLLGKLDASLAASEYEGLEVTS